MNIDQATIDFFKHLYWDYNISEADIALIIARGEYKGITRKNLLARALQYRRWYEIKNVLSTELIKEALSDDILNALFPKSLSHQYNYVKEILYQ